MDKKKLKKISTRPFLFGLERLLFKKEVLYYDKQNLHIENKEGFQIFPLNSIASIKKTNNQVNNRMQWEIVLNHANKMYSFKFFHNWSGWNYNFPDFLDMIEKRKPGTVKSNFFFLGV